MISRLFQGDRFEGPAMLSFQTGSSRMYLTELKQLRRDCRIWLTAKQEKVWNLHVRQQSTRSLRQSNMLHEDALWSITHLKHTEFSRRRSSYIITSRESYINSFFLKLKKMAVKWNTSGAYLENNKMNNFTRRQSTWLGGTVFSSAVIWYACAEWRCIWRLGIERCRISRHCIQQRCIACALSAGAIMRAEWCKIVQEVVQGVMVKDGAR